MSLAQGAILQVGQKFPFWLSNSKPIILEVTYAEPSNVVRPVHNLEMSVEPRPRDLDFDSEEEAEEGQTVAKRITWLRVIVPSLLPFFPFASLLQTQQQALWLLVQTAILLAVRDRS